MKDNQRGGSFRGKPTLRRRSYGMGVALGERRFGLSATVQRRHKWQQEEIMGAILELTSYAATVPGMIAIVVLAGVAYLAARWVFSD
jgi:hypothetical protein